MTASNQAFEILHDVQDVPEAPRNIIVIGNSGAGKSLFCSILSNNYEKFQISNDMVKRYPEAKFVQETVDYSNQKYCIFDYEGPQTYDDYKNLLQKEQSLKE